MTNRHIWFLFLTSFFMVFAWSLTGLEWLGWSGLALMAPTFVVAYIAAGHNRKVAH